LAGYGLSEASGPRGSAPTAGEGPQSGLGCLPTARTERNPRRVARRWQQIGHRIENVGIIKQLRIGNDLINDERELLGLGTGERKLVLHPSGGVEFGIEQPRLRVG